MESVGRKLKKQSFRKVIIYFLTCCLVLNTSMPIVWAEVIWHSTVQGTITVTPLNGGTKQDMTASDGAIGHFSDFDIATGHVVDCVQPSNNASALFRVIEGGVTDIYGTFKANGNIYLINPAGILFGEGSQINVNRLVASGMDMSDAVFNAVRTNPAAKMVFTKYMGEIFGDVINEGTITAAESAYLVGRNVTNTGSILCPNGLVVMAASDAVQLGQPNSDVIVTLADLNADGDNIVDNLNGTVGAPDGRVDKLVLAAGDVWSQAISNVKKVKIASFDNPDLSDITAYADVSSDADSEVDIEVGGVLNIDYHIKATAVGDVDNDATATIKIDAGGSVGIDNAEVLAEASCGPANTATVDIDADGNVEVNGDEEGGTARVYACAHDGSLTNSADVLICADGDVQVKGMMGGNAEISAEASSEYSNTARVGIGAKGDEGVEVRAEDGSAFIESRAYDGYENTAETVVCTEGGVLVVDKGGEVIVGTAGITAVAMGGNYNDAYVGVRAEDDILVMAGLGPEDLLTEEGIDEGTGGHAEIRAEASSLEAGEETSANAETVVYSRNGGVAVIDAIPIEEPRSPDTATAEILSRATNGYTNTAYTGVYAGGELGDLLNEEHPLYVEFQDTGVVVLGVGDLSQAIILSETSGDYVNTSNTVVCTPYEVFVQANGYLSNTEIGAVAEGDGFNAATTQVYASDVYVYIPSYSGEGGIWANAYGWPIVPFVGKEVFVLSDYNGEYGNQELEWVAGGPEGDDDIATLKIKDYSKRQDCPEAPECPCEEPIRPVPVPQVKPAAVHPFVPAAPVPEIIVLEISGYPALMSWVAEELGVEPENIQIGVANSLASSKGIQPYNRFSRLRKAAAILRDAGGVYMNALAQVITEFASSTVPPTNEQMASIANAISSNAGANNQYALAGQYLDALAEYVSILRELGFSGDAAVQLAMDNYIQNLTEGQTGVAAFMSARLAAMGG